MYDLLLLYEFHVKLILKLRTLFLYIQGEQHSVLLYNNCRHCRLSILYVVSKHEFLITLYTNYTYIYYTLVIGTF